MGSLYLFNNSDITCWARQRLELLQLSLQKDQYSVSFSVCQFAVPIPAETLKFHLWEIPRGCDALDYQLPSVVQQIM